MAEEEPHRSFVDIFLWDQNQACRSIVGCGGQLEGYCGDDFSHAEIKEPNPICAVKQLHTGLWNYETKQCNKRWRKGILQDSLDFIHSITTIAPIRTISSWMSLWHVLWHVETDTDVVAS